MDRLVVSDVKEVNITFKKNQNCSTTFRLTNLMHTMHVAISLSTTNPSIFSFTPQPFSVLPPLSTSSFTLRLSHPSDHPPLSSPQLDSISVRSSMLPVGKAHQDDLRRIFSKPGAHIFRDATIPISFVGPQVVEFLISSSSYSSRSSVDAEIDLRLKKAISGCSDSQLTSLLRPAVESGDDGFVNALIDAGGDVNYRDDGGEGSVSESIMSTAVRFGNIDIVRVLIASGCSINKSIDRFLHDAAAKNRVDLMEVLCDGFEDLDVNLVDSDGWSAIHVAAIRGNVEALKFLISIGGNPNVSDSNGWIPLHFAAAKGHLEAVEYLLNCSSFVKFAVTKDGNTPFALAMENNHCNLFDLLHLGDVLQRAARVNDVHGLKSCITEGAKVNGRDQNGWTPLHRAAFKGRIEIVKVLLSRGAQVDLVDDAGYTPLHCAVEAGHLEVALCLIAHGAKVHVKSLNSMVPFNLDCYEETIKMKTKTKTMTNQHHHPSSLGVPLCCEK